MPNLMHDPRLYAILDLGYTPEKDAFATTNHLLAGGADILQLRAKGCDEATIRRVAAKLVPLCREANVPFILNDFPRLATELGSDGVHIGQDDGSIEDARRIVGPGKIIGRSTHSLDQARDALAEGFDYIGFGPLFPTLTKAGRPDIGLENIATMEAEVGCHIPAFCIGGIKQHNLPEVLTSGARRVVIVSELLQASDIRTAARAAKEQIIMGSQARS